MRGQDQQRKRREAVTGYCNACGKFSTLTWDHVPPQGSIAISPVEVTNFLAYSYGRGKHPRAWIAPEEALNEHHVGAKRRSQNGLKFQTLCGHCNNALLGGRYDPELKRVCRRVGVILRTARRIDLPSRIDVPVKTHRLLRSIVGHLLAAHGSLDQNSPLPGFEQGLWRDLREYFLDESLPIPDRLCAYYWPYPSNTHIIIPALGISSRDGKKSLLGALIKFFPLAFFLVDKTASDLKPHLPAFMGDGCNDLSCAVDLSIELTRIPSLEWPELIPDEQFYTGMPVAAASVAQPLPKRDAL